MEYRTCREKTIRRNVNGTRKVPFSAIIVRTLGSSVFNINHSFVDINTFMRYDRDEQADDWQKDYDGSVGRVF